MLSFLRKTALWIVLLPLLCFYLGVTSNQLVLSKNNNRFPVMWNSYKVLHYAQEIEKATHSEDPDVAAQAKFDLKALTEGGYIDDTHVIMTNKTHLNFLADWIDLHTATYSPGDILIELGDKSMAYSPWIWAVVAIGKLRRREERY